MGAFYSYDAAGERNYKLVGATVSVSQNGNNVNLPVFDRQTLYASPLITITDKGYTKHYFEEGNRICSSIGGGRLGLVDEAEPIVTPWDECKTALRQGVLDTYRQNFAVEPHTDDIVDLYETVEYWSGKDTDEPTFYYHTDHLGSATLITDDAADVVQQIAYLPYGEDWIDVRSNGYFGSAYKFNGKEKDDETGYSYYGARYYTDRLSIFLSVDRFAEKFPWQSPYCYAGNNPIRYMDINGDSVFIKNNKDILLYDNGTLRNKDGSEYLGKQTSFTKKVREALNIIGSTKEGQAMLSELQSSNNSYTIQKSTRQYNYESKFVYEDMDRAHALQMAETTGKSLLKGGAGGDIYWNSKGTLLNTEKGYQKNSIIDLGHELFHALDANRGLLDGRVYNGLSRKEWQATYRENILRQELHLPLRTYYYNTFVLCTDNKPFAPYWYKH